MVDETVVNVDKAAMGHWDAKEVAFFIRGGPNLCLLLLKLDAQHSQQLLHKPHSTAGLLLQPGSEH
jgi:hypothetical protein